MKIISVVGARPNFMKIAPFIKAIDKHNSENPTSKIEHLLVHTGQHYDDRMSRAFFDALNIPDADINLEVGSGTHAQQVGNTMIAFEKVLEENRPDWVVVVGDVNATLACSVTAKKLHIKVCHIEAGLRSGDNRMPEEINRLVTDRLSDLLLVPDRLSIKNLQAEGAPEKAIQFVGNIMIDTLENNREKAQEFDINSIVEENKLDGQAIDSISEKFALVTLHRPSNVDHKENFGAIVNFLQYEVCSDMPIVWPVHPRAKKQLESFGLWGSLVQNPRIVLLHPLGYHQMLRMNMGSRVVLTDSGGLQEECTVLGSPCLTLRWNTERPITLKENGGVSVLVGNNIERIREEYSQILSEKPQPVRPELWDGKTAERCVAAILRAE